MTTDTRTPAELRYDLERSGDLYSKPADDSFGTDVTDELIAALEAVKSDISAYINACLAQEQANPNLFMRQVNGTNGCMSYLVKRYGMEGAAERVAAAQQAREDITADSRNDVLIGHIDGCEVLAHYLTDKNDPDQDDLAAATVIWQGIEISTDGHSYLSFPMDGCFVGDMQIAEWAALKRAAQTDIPERLIALAQRYPRYRDVPPLLPPTPPAVPAIRVVQLWEVDGDYNRDGIGQLAFIGYKAGEGDDSAEVSFQLDGSHPPHAYLFGGDDVDLDVAERTIANLQAVLADPRVQAARAAHPTA